MRPVLFRVGHRSVPSYSSCLYLGLIAGVYVAAIESARMGVDANHVVAAVLVLVPVALVGARLWFMVTNWRLLGLSVRETRRQFFSRGEGGLAMFGGLMLALPVSALVTWLLRVGFGSFWDAASFVLLVGMAFARVGCWLNGCCSGRAPRNPHAASVLQRLGMRVLPTQLVEALTATALTLAGFFLVGRVGFGGALFLVQLGAYCMVRLWLEGWRRSDPLSQRRNRRICLVALSASSVLLMIGWPGLA